MRWIASWSGEQARGRWARSDLVLDAHAGGPCLAGRRPGAPRRWWWWSVRALHVLVTATGSRIPSLVLPRRVGPFFCPPRWASGPGPEDAGAVAGASWHRSTSPGACPFRRLASMPRASLRPPVRSGAGTRRLAPREANGVRPSPGRRQMTVRTSHFQPTLYWGGNFAADAVCLLRPGERQEITRVRHTVLVRSDLILRPSVGRAADGRKVGKIFRHTGFWRYAGYMTAQSHTG
jgi:hypothetical protein